MAEQAPRSLEERLGDYARVTRQTSLQLTKICDTLEERFGEAANTVELRATAEVQELLANDLDKILRGEELSGYAITGVIPSGD